MKLLKGISRKRIGFEFSFMLLIFILVIPATVAAADWTSIGPAGVSVRDFAVSPAYATDHEIVVLDSRATDWCVYYP